MSSTYTTKLLKQFGRTDGLLGGGTMATGLIVYCIIATTEGFGREGVVLATFLIFFLSAVLEIPTGYFGDRFSWKFSVRLGLLCDIAATLLFSLTVVCAIYGFYIWMLIFLVLKQLFTALNGAFTSGPYQEAYQHWYKEKLKDKNKKISDAPPLFLASYQYGVGIRLMLPLIALGLGLLLHTEKVSHITKEYVTFIPLGLILYTLIIQVVTYFKMAKDLDFKSTSIKNCSKNNITITKLFLSAQATLPVLCTYAFSHIFIQVNHLFLIGESYYLLKEANLPPLLVWGSGMGATVIISFFGINISRFFIPWLSKQTGLRAIRWLGTMTLSILATLAAIVFYSDISTYTKITCIFLVILVASPISFALRAEIASDSHQFVPDEFKASWFSAGTLLASFTYAMITGLILILGIPHMGIFVMMSVLGIIGISLTFINYKKGEYVSKFEHASLRKCLGMVVGIMFFIASFTVFLGESWYFVQHTTESQRKQDHVVAEKYALQLSHTKDALKVDQLTNILMLSSSVNCVDININIMHKLSCNPSFSTHSVTESIYQDLLEKRVELGTVTVYFNDSTIHQKTLHHLIIVAAIYIAFVLLIFNITYRVVKRICGEAKMVLDVAMDKSFKKTNDVDGEARYFIDEFATMADRFNGFIENEKKMVNLEGVNQVAVQVAHDIRSPLTAFEMIAEQASHAIPISSRNILRSALDSMKDIVNGLLVMERENNVDKDPAKHQISEQLLSTLFEEVISEKRIQFRRDKRVELQYQIDNDAYGVFVNIHANTLRRVLSNLINNSAKSKGEKNSVNIQLRLRVSNNNAVITATDNGLGISSELTDNILERGVSIGKPSKTDLELFHAKAVVESWHGTFTIASEPGMGTQITIALPLQPAPQWFLPLLNLPSNAQVMILDDDASMHSVWWSRLASFSLEDLEVDVHYFRNGTQLKEFYQQEIESSRPLVFLSDYELTDCENNGLDIIEALQVAEHSVLVTSHYKNTAVLNRCTQLGVKILPKSLVNWMPIEVSGLDAVNSKALHSERLTFDAVHIDDSTEIRICWRMYAEQYQINLLSLASPKEFERYVGKISLQTPIYIDNKFVGEETSGVEWAKTLYEQGFKRLILTTGLVPKFANEMYWLEDIIEKRPPWTKARKGIRQSEEILV